jgi:hypothetical protein
MDGSNFFGVVMFKCDIFLLNNILSYKDSDSRRIFSIYKRKYVLIILYTYEHIFLSVTRILFEYTTY